MVTRLLQKFRDNKIFFLGYLLRRMSWMFPSDKLYLRLMYLFEMHHVLHLKHPKTFTEKIQWLKIYDYKPWYTKLVDKLAVKEYVSQKIGNEYVIPTIGVWNNAEDINWKSLPEKFVLKTTHSGGGGGTVLCRNKALLDKEAAVKRLNRSLRKSISSTFREKPYEKVPRRIIAEQLIEEHDEVGNITNNDLPDYKFFCFNGEPQYCQVIRNRNTKETIDFYDMQWRHMPFVGLNPNATNGAVPVNRPKNLQQLQTICRELSKGLKFVRIDLYVVNDKEYFGEITFYPNSGFGKFTPNEWDKKLGEMLKLEGVKLGGGKTIPN